MTQDHDFEAIVIGAGSGGVACATGLTQGGMRRVAVIERERVGGECAYWACVPSKVLLRSEQPLADAKRVPGSRPHTEVRPDFARATAWRTAMVDQYDDSAHASKLIEAHAQLLRGAAHIEGPGVVSVDGDQYRTKNIIIATGSTDEIPDIDGLQQGPYWLSRDATAAGELPKRLVILGGGAVGIELGQMFARFGAEVVLIEAASHILSNESAGIAEIMSGVLKKDGVEICVGAKVVRTAFENNSVNVQLDNSRTVSGSKLLVAAGRRARTAGLGLENIGIKLDDRGNIPIDDTCRAAPDVYAVGDVTGKSMFTHTAKFQSRIVVAAIFKHDSRASYEAVPRCIFTDPEIAAVGTTLEQARDAGIDTICARVTFDEVTRPAIYFEDGAIGAIELVGDRTKERLIGGWVVGPMASEMTAFMSMAILGDIEINALLKVVQPYPTFSEAFYVAVDRLTNAIESDSAG